MIQQLEARHTGRHHILCGDDCLLEDNFLNICTHISLKLPILGHFLKYVLLLV